LVKIKLKNMKVILLQDLKKHGTIGDIVEVKSGFARNYLFPNNIALYANKKNISFYKDKEKDLAKKNEIVKQKALDIKEKILSLGDTPIDIIVAASKEGKLYGTITSNEIADILKEKYSIVVKPQLIKVKDKIKMLGTYPVFITLFTNIEITINIKLIAKQLTT